MGRLDGCNILCGFFWCGGGGFGFLAMPRGLQNLSSPTRD